MLKYKLLKLPFNLKKRLVKNNSQNNLRNKGTTKRIFKIRERLFSPKSLSLLSKNNFYFNNNNTNLLPSLSPNNNVNIKEIDKFPIKYLDNQMYLSLLLQRRNPIKSDTVDEINPIQSQRLSQMIQSHLKLNRKDSKIFVDESSSSKSKESDSSYMLINQIIKFDVKKKKEKEQKNLIPMQLGKEYQDFIEKKNKLNFNPNFNSPYIHKVYSNYMVDNILNKKQLELQSTKHKLIFNKKQKIEKQKELELELKDKIEENDVDLQKYKRIIKQFLKDETKLNRISFHEKFFDSYVNKINFLFDDRKFPTIKNNLKKIKLTIKNAGEYEWNFLNMMEIHTLTYLHKLKVKIQRELDELEGEDNKEKQFNINKQIGIYNTSEDEENNNNNFDINNNNLDYIDINFLNNNEDMYDENKNIEKIKILTSFKEDKYNLEQFFLHKKYPYKTIYFADNKLSKIVYTNHKFYESFGAKKKIDEKDIINKSEKKEKEIDYYL